MGGTSPGRVVAVAALVGVAIAVAIVVGSRGRTTRERPRSEPPPPAMPSPAPAAPPRVADAPVEPTPTTATEEPLPEPETESSLFLPWPGQKACVVVVEVTEETTDPEKPGLPVADASVEFVWARAMADLPPARELVGWTGADGRLAVAVRPWQEPRVFARAAGFVPGGGEVVVRSSEDADVPPARIDARIVLSRPGILRGTVLALPDGKRVAGATVESVDFRHGKVLASTKTGADGRFEIPVANKAQAHLEVSHPGLGRTSDPYPLPGPAQRAPGELDGWPALPEGDRCFVLQPESVFRGTVVGPDGSPVSDAFVAAERWDYTGGAVTDYGAAMPERGVPRPDGWQHWTRTDASGSFELRGVDADASAVRIGARAPGFAPSDELFLRSRAMDATGPIALRLRAAGGVRVHVVDAEGRPVACEPPVLRLYSGSDWMAGLPMREANRGVWVRGDLAVGEWWFDGGRYDLDEVLVVREGQTTERTLVLGGPRSSIAGRVTDDDGRPVPGATIRASRLVPGARTTVGAEPVTSDDEGRYRIDGLREGAHVVHAHVSGLDGPPVRAVAGGAPVELKAPTIAHVRVEVRATTVASDAPVPWVWIDALGPVLPFGHRVWRGPSPAVLRIPVDPAATVLRLGSPGFGTREFPLALKAGGSADVGIVDLEPGRRRLVRVLDDEGEPVEHALASCLGQEWSTAEDGAVWIEDLPAEPIPFRVTHDAFLPHEGTLHGGADLPEVVVRLRRGAELRAALVSPHFLPAAPDWTARARRVDTAGNAGAPEELRPHLIQSSRLVVEPGRWRIEVVRDGVVVAVKEEEVPEGGTLEVEMPAVAR